MTVAGLVIAVAMFAPAGQATALGGLTAPERITRSYDVQCAGGSGGVVLEERFNKSIPSGSVEVRSFTPLGAGKAGAASEALTRAAAQMARIERVAWSCDGPRALMRIDYLDRGVFEQSVREDRPLPAEQDRVRRTTLVLDRRGLTVESTGTERAAAAAGEASGGN